MTYSATQTIAPDVRLCIKFSGLFHGFLGVTPARATSAIPYMTKHMPLVDEKFKPFGIKGWRVLKAVGTPFGGKPAYSIIANLEFDTADQFRAAVAAESGPVFGDVPNFSNKSPVVVIGDLVGAAP